MPFARQAGFVLRRISRRPSRRLQDVRSARANRHRKPHYDSSAPAWQQPSCTSGFGRRAPPVLPVACDAGMLLFFWRGVIRSCASCTRTKWSAQWAKGLGNEESVCVPSLDLEISLFQRLYNLLQLMESQSKPLNPGRRDSTEESSLAMLRVSGMPMLLPSTQLEGIIC